VQSNSYMLLMPYQCHQVTAGIQPIQPFLNPGFIEKFSRSAVTFSMTFPEFSISKVIFHDFPDLENFNFKFHDFPDFSRICTNPVNHQAITAPIYTAKATSYAAPMKSTNKLAMHISF